MTDGTYPQISNPFKDLFFSFLYLTIQALTPFYVNMKSKFEINTPVLSYVVDLVLRTLHFKGFFLLIFCAAVFKR